MSSEDLSRTAAAVISEARQMSGRTNAEFDYDVKLHGVGGPNGPLGQAAYTVATRDMTVTATTDERETEWLSTWSKLRPEMNAYAQRCRARRFSGWSNANRNPIRYA